jgi:hypothetical protein
MPSRLHPERGVFLALERTPQLPEMFAAVMKIQQLHRLFPAIGFPVPNPGRTVAQPPGGLGPSQSPAQCFPVQAPAQFHRLALPTHDGFVAQHAPPVMPLRRLLVPIKHAGLDFMPFDARLWRLLSPPTGTPKPRQPTIHQQDGQGAGLATGFEFLGRSLPPGLRWGFGWSTHALHHRMQRRVVHRTAPLDRHRGGLFP